MSCQYSNCSSASASHPSYSPALGLGRTIFLTDRPYRLLKYLDSKFQGVELFATSDEAVSAGVKWFNQKGATFEIVQVGIKNITIDVKY